MSEDSKHELTEEDAVFAKVIEDAGIGASPIPDDHGTLCYVTRIYMLV